MKINIKELNVWRYYLKKSIVTLLLVAALAAVYCSGGVLPLKSFLGLILPQGEKEDYSAKILYQDTTDISVQEQTVSTEPISEELIVENELNLSGPYEVVKVVDGDTLDVNIDGKTERVRMIGIDTPESVHNDPSKNTEEGAFVSDFMKEYVKGKSIYLEFDVGVRDKYDRLLAYVYLEDEMLNKMLLELGYARVMTIQPNVKYCDVFIIAQRQAKDANQGFWKDFYN